MSHSTQLAWHQDAFIKFKSYAISCFAHLCQLDFKFCLFFPFSKLTMTSWSPLPAWLWAWPFPLFQSWPQCRGQICRLNFKHNLFFLFKVDRKFATNCASSTSSVASFFFSKLTASSQPTSPAWLWAWLFLFFELTANSQPTVRAWFWAWPFFSSFQSWPQVYGQLSQLDFEPGLFSFFQSQPRVCGHLPNPTSGMVLYILSFVRPVLFSLCFQWHVFDRVIHFSLNCCTLSLCSHFSPLSAAPSIMHWGLYYLVVTSFAI